MSEKILSLREIEEHFAKRKLEKMFKGVDSYFSGIRDELHGSSGQSLKIGVVSNLPGNCSYAEQLQEEPDEK